MIISIKYNKHFEQIKKGGIVIVAKKLRALFYLILQIPIYLISVPTAIIIRLIRPWFLIRWQQLTSSRIGHFGTNTELYCCERDARINTPSQRYLDIFYLRKYVCNKQMEKMWRRNLIILPRWLLFPLFFVNRFIGRFISDGYYHEIGGAPHKTWDNKDPKIDSYFVASSNITINRDRDVYNLIDQSEPHMNFTYDEESEGKKLLTQFGLSQDAKFVCLAVRDSTYLDRHRQFTLLKDRRSYHSYRNGNIDDYILAAEELTKRGYYVFRMGAKVEKPMKSSNPKVIDYANSGMRSEFMDIYLGAKCSFCISTALGFDAIPYIFRKPLVFIYVPLGYPWTSSDKHLLITKHHIHKEYKKKLTLSEIFSFNVAMAQDTKTYEINNIELKENSPEEIKDLVIEMDERLNGSWNETEEDRSLQKQFWSIFNNNIKKLNLEKPLHGKIKSRFGAKFLRENKNWIR